MTIPRMLLAAPLALVLLISASTAQAQISLADAVVYGAAHEAALAVDRVAKIQREAAMQALVRELPEAQDFDDAVLAMDRLAEQLLDLRNYRWDEMAMRNRTRAITVLAVAVSRRIPAVPFTESWRREDMPRLRLMDTVTITQYSAFGGAMSVAAEYFTATVSAVVNGNSDVAVDLESLATSMGFLGIGGVAMDKVLSGVMPDGRLANRRVNLLLRFLRRVGERVEGATALDENRFLAGSYRRLAGAYCSSLLKMR